MERHWSPTPLVWPEAPISSDRHVRKVQLPVPDFKNIVMDSDDYESLPTNNVAIHMTAGAFAGIMEHIVMYPVDCVKTQMQSLAPAGSRPQGMMMVLRSMLLEEGWLRPLRGVSAMVMGAGPAHALYFSCYERMKQILSFSTPADKNYVAHGLAGAMATVCHDAMMTPADAVKQRMQMMNSPYRSCSDCISTVLRTEGYHAFYRAFGTQLLMNIPFQSTHFIIYEWMQNLTNPGRTYNPGHHMLAGATAGGLAAALTTPLDVCKTLLNTQENQVLTKFRRSEIRGLPEAFKTVYRLRGFRGYFQGIVPRTVNQMPSTAIAWSVYEFLKHMMYSNSSERQEAERKEEERVRRLDSQRTPNHPIVSNANCKPWTDVLCEGR